MMRRRSLSSVVVGVIHVIIYFCMILCVIYGYDHPSYLYNHRLLNVGKNCQCPPTPPCSSELRALNDCPASPPCPCWHTKIMARKQFKQQTTPPSIPGVSQSASNVEARIKALIERAQAQSDVLRVLEETLSGIAGGEHHLNSGDKSDKLNDPQVQREIIEEIGWRAARGQSVSKRLVKQYNSVIRNQAHHKSASSPPQINNISNTSKTTNKSSAAPACSPIAHTRLVGGSILESSMVANFGECCQLCANIPDCTQYAFDSTDSQCWAYDRAATKHPDDKWTTGVTSEHVPPNRGDRLNSDTPMSARLYSGQSLQSHNGLYELRLDETGVLSLHDKSSPMWSWQQNSPPKGKPPFRLTITDTGEVRLEDSTEPVNEVVWNSPTTAGDGPYTFVVNNDRNLFVYDKTMKCPGSECAWTSNTGILTKDECVFEESQAYNGHELTSHHLVSPNECCAQCKKGVSIGCKFWTFEAVTRSCTLFGDGATALYKEGFIGGTHLKASPRSISSGEKCESMDGRRYIGALIDGKNVSDVRMCCEYCSTIPACVYWSFQESAHHCFVHGKNGVESLDVSYRGGRVASHVDSNRGNQLNSSSILTDRIWSDECVVANNGKYKMCLDKVGALKLTTNTSVPRVIHEFNDRTTDALDHAGYSLVMMEDGNLAILDDVQHDHRIVWQTGTSTRGDGPPYTLRLQNNRNAVVFDHTQKCPGCPWASHTETYAYDGCVVAHTDRIESAQTARPVKNTHNAGECCEYCKMELDCRHWSYNVRSHECRTFVRDARLNRTQHDDYISGSTNAYKLKGMCTLWSTHSTSQERVAREQCEGNWKNVGVPMMTIQVPDHDDIPFLHTDIAYSPGWDWAKTKMCCATEESSDPPQLLYLSKTCGSGSDALGHLGVVVHRNDVSRVPLDEKQPLSPLWTWMSGSVCRSTNVTQVALQKGTCWFAPSKDACGSEWAPSGQVGLAVTRPMSDAFISASGFATGDSVDIDTPSSVWTYGYLCCRQQQHT